MRKYTELTENENMTSIFEKYSVLKEMHFNRN